MLNLTSVDAKLLADTMAGKGKAREVLAPYPDLCFDVSKGIMKAYANLTPTVTFQMLLTGYTMSESEFVFNGLGTELRGTISDDGFGSTAEYDGDSPPFITTNALLSISKVIGQPGGDYCFVFHPHGLLFERENNVCYITIERFFKIVVDRMKVSKSDVLFENSACDTNQILISRSKRRLF